MIKVNNKDTRKRHWPCSDVFVVNFTYFTRCSSVSIVEFEQLNVDYELVLWISIYPREKRRHLTTVFLVNIKRISHLVFMLYLFYLLINEINWNLLTSDINATCKNRNSSSWLIFFSIFTFENSNVWI